MAEHDYVIDNQTAPNFRADLNNALLAIVSNNSKATEPTVPYANMTWYDTATNILYMRNEDNDAWIALGTLNQSTNTFTPAGSLALASQAEAEAGTDNTKVMTPLLLRNALNATGTAPTYACRAWVNFAGNANGLIRGAGNVSSVTYNTIGDYTINFTTALSGDTYATSGLCSQSGQGGSPDGISIISKSGSSLRVNTRYANSAVQGQFNPGFVEIAVFQ
jgi:hypothetical protein